MRRLLPLVLLLAGCGSSAASPTATPRLPTATPDLGYTDPSSGVNVRILAHSTTPTYGLFNVQIRNRSKRDYSPPSAVPLVDSALTSPGQSGTVGACDSDFSRGSGLAYTSVPANSTHSGWIRCDYPRGTRVVAVFWLGHEIGAWHL